MKPKVSISPRLIQRMGEPTVRDGKPVVNPFSFGGGFRNGGLSDEAMDILGRVVSFDYMGLAEFEFGALATSFSAIAEFAKVDKMVIGEQKVTYNGKAKMLYFYSPAEIADDVCKIVKNLSGERTSFNLKANALVHESLWSGKSHYERVTGWIDIKHHYLFFKNKETRDKMAAIFEEVRQAHVEGIAKEYSEFVG